MVVLSKIYTKTGDDGETSLVNGVRVAKYSLRVNAYGTVDELNANVGMARLIARDQVQIEQALARISNDLFDLGADLATPEVPSDSSLQHKEMHILSNQVNRLEAEIDTENARLKPLRSFVLPGGSALATQLHICRTVCRRAERLVVELAATESVNAEAIKYLNRLSDWVFVMARVANDCGAGDVLWVPGLTR